MASITFWILVVLIDCIMVYIFILKCIFLLYYKGKKLD